MRARAEEVVRLLDALKNDTPVFASSLHFSTSTSDTLVSVHPHSLEKGVGPNMGMGIMDVDAPDRAPKRPWEDVEGMLPLPPGGTSGIGQTVSLAPGTLPLPASVPQPAVPGNTDQDRTTAEADMQLIRTKRALTTMAAAAALGGGGGSTAAAKNKYRKRSVSPSCMGEIWC